MELLIENDKKIKRHSEIQGIILEKKQDFDLPDSISEYRDLMVFQDGAFNGLENELLEPPMICDKTIRLSEEEIANLFRGPKFAVREE